MATFYEQLYRLIQAPVGGHRLWRQMYTAVLAASASIRSEATDTPNHANRLLWAEAAEQDPDARVKEMRTSLLVNEEAIRNAPDATTDADVQTAVNSLVDTFATGS